MITNVQASIIDAETKTKILGIFKSGDEISVSLIQCKCIVGYISASRVLEDLINNGLVSRVSKYGNCKFI